MTVHEVVEAGEFAARGVIIAIAAIVITIMIPEGKILWIFYVEARGCFPVVLANPKLPAKFPSETLNSHRL
jgi:hypothetical protein